MAERYSLDFGKCFWLSRRTKIREGQFLVLVLPIPMANNKIKKQLDQEHGGTSAHVIKHGCKVLRNSGYMFDRESVAKGYLV